MYDVLLHPDAEKSYANADKALAKKIDRCLQQLEQTPRFHPNIKALKAQDFKLGDSNMTLSEVLPAVRQLSVIEKLKLIRILAEDLEAAEDISPLEPFKTYDLPTPYNSFGAGAALMQALESADQA